jgi:salicylate hydroxylase
MVYRGYVAYNDLSPETAQLLRRTVNFRGPQRHVITLPIGNDESNSARVGVIGFMTEPLETWTSEGWLAKAPVDDLYAHVKDWTGAVQEIITGLRKGAADGLILKQALYVRELTEKWFQTEQEPKNSGVILIGDSVHSTLPHQGTYTSHQTNVFWSRPHRVADNVIIRSRRLHGNRIRLCIDPDPATLAVGRPGGRPAVLLECP